MEEWGLSQLTSLLKLKQVRIGSPKFQAQLENELRGA